MDAISKLESHGYRFWLEEDGVIRFEYKGANRPDPAIVRPLVAELRERKHEAVTHIRNHQAWLQQPQAIDYAAVAAEIKEILAKEGIVRINSRTLGEDVFWAWDEVQAAKASKNMVVYTLAEVEEMGQKRLTKEALRRVHQVKKLFGGRIVGADARSFTEREGEAKESNAG